VATEGDAGRGSLEGSVSAETGEGSAASVVEGESVAVVASAGTGSDTTRTGEASGRVGVACRSSCCFRTSCIMSL